MEIVIRSALTFLVGTAVHAEVDLKQMDPHALVSIELLLVLVPWCALLLRCCYTDCVL